MPPKAVGRNDPCPCGSGKKYKKCCLSRDQAKVTASSASGHDDHHHHRQAGPTPMGIVHIPPGMSEVEAEAHVKCLEDWADNAWTAFEAGRDEEVEGMCRRLIDRYPDQIDGHEILGALRERQGRWEEAVREFERALVIALRHEDHFDPKVIDDLAWSADHARHHAAEGSPCSDDEPSKPRIPMEKMPGDPKES
jgi:tetratricopeptide (TPR) repeat protein